MIHVIEEFLHVSTPEVAVSVFSQKVLRPINGIVQSLFLSARPRVVDEHSVVDQLQIVVHESVQQTVAQRSHGDLSSFVVAHCEYVVCAVTVRPMHDISVQVDDVFFDVVPEVFHVLRAFLPELESEVALP
jgi:hypothetical protein